MNTPVEKAVQELEQRYAVQPQASFGMHAPTGEPYILFLFGQQFDDRPTYRNHMTFLVDVVFDRITRHFANVPTGARLWWREAPHWEYNFEHHALYFRARLLISSAPVKPQSDS